MRLLRCTAVVGLALGICLVSFGEMYTWTSRDGKKAAAEFQALEGDTLVLQKGSKTIRVPLAQFCDEDQEYVRTLLAEAQAEQERLEQERLDHVKTLLGLKNNVPITERRWADWEDYYTESLCGSKMLKFFQNERSVVDVPKEGVFVSAEEAVRPPDYAPSMMTYCPADYGGKEKIGVYIHIATKDDPVRPSKGYQELMDKYRLVYASPYGTSNKQADMRRCALALDALAQLRKDFVIDENRIYIGGASGGGAEATFATFLYPQDFRAALNAVRYFILESRMCLPFADRSDFRTSSKYQQPFAFISGPDDYGYKDMPASEESFRDHGFVVRFFDIPGMKHELASTETLDRVIEWIEANNPRL